MTTIRKIVTSKIDGNDANATNTDEIRPYGEIAIYQEWNGVNDRPVLSMFDGARTHLKSKVLGPGVLYGSNNDSGDGEGFDTIKLIPDATLHYNDGNFGNNQYLVVDPTQPNHIHLRAGGSIDNSSSDLFIGGEKNFVKVSDSTDTVTIRTTLTAEGDTNYDWTFDNFGKLTFPNGTTTSGNGITPPVDSPFELSLHYYPTVAAQANGLSDADNFYTNISEVDDIIVVQPGWQINSGTSQAPIWRVVTEVATVDSDYKIVVPGFGFIAGLTYTFRNPATSESVWQFDEFGNFVTPGSGSISHRNNDLLLAVNNTDVIVLRTGGGEVVVSANGDVLLSNDLVFNNNVKVTTGGAMDQNAINVIVPDSMDSNTTYKWSFDASYGIPYLEFPNGTLQSTAWSGGRVVEVPLSSIGASGDKEGDLAFNGSYIYYCTADYTSHVSSITVDSDQWGGASGGLTSLPFSSVREPQIGWTIFVTFNTGPVSTTITGVTSLGGNRYQIDFNSVGEINVSNGNTGTLLDNIPEADIWKRLAWSGDTW